MTSLKDVVEDLKYSSSENFAELDKIALTKMIVKISKIMPIWFRIVAMPKGTSIRMGKNQPPFKPLEDAIKKHLSSPIWGLASPQNHLHVTMLAKKLKNIAWATSFVLQKQPSSTSYFFFLTDFWLLIRLIVEACKSKILSHKHKH